jgi:hypothetical protein
MVIMLDHGPLDSLDGSHQVPFAAVRLGGTSVDRRDVGRIEYDRETGTLGDTLDVTADWVTANELEGRITNPKLILVVPGCRGGRTNRLYRATRATLFVGNKDDTVSVTVVNALKWVVDYSNSGEQMANEKYLATGYGAVINPMNGTF